MGIIIFFEDMANSLDRRSYHETGNGSTEGIPRKIILCYRFNGRTGDRYGFDFFLGAYEIGMISIAFTTVGIKDGNAYGMFLQTIPYRFYNIFAVAMVIIIILMQRDYGPMYQAEKRARLTGKLYEDTARPMMSKELDAMNVAEGAPLRCATLSFRF